MSASLLQAKPECFSDNAPVRRLMYQPSKSSSRLHLVTLLVRDYDEAIAFFVDKLGFTLQEDSPSVTKEGHPKRWVVVQPSPEASGAASCGASLLLAQADGPAQADLVGQQFGGRVGFFWRVDDFQRTYDRLHRAGVELIEEPRSEPYGTVVVFKDLYGNLWDLLGP